MLSYKWFRCDFIFTSVWQPDVFVSYMSHVKVWNLQINNTVYLVSNECQVRLLWIIHLQEVWFGVLHHVCGDHKWAEGECKHFPEETPSNGKTYLKKSSKPLAALRKVVLDKKWLSNLAFYVRFRFVITSLTILFYTIFPLQVPPPPKKNNANENENDNKAELKLG